MLPDLQICYPLLPKHTQNLLFFITRAYDLSVLVTRTYITRTYWNSQFGVPYYQNLQSFLYSQSVSAYYQKLLTVFPLLTICYCLLPESTHSLLLFPEVTLCSWWDIKIQALTNCCLLSLDRVWGRGAGTEHTHVQTGGSTGQHYRLCICQSSWYRHGHVYTQVCLKTHLYTGLSHNMLTHDSGCLLQVNVFVVIWNRTRPTPTHQGVNTWKASHKHNNKDLSCLW